MNVSISIQEEISFFYNILTSTNKLSQRKRKKKYDNIDRHITLTQSTSE